MKNFTATEQQVVWRISIDIVAKYAATIFTEETNDNKHIVNDLFEIYSYEYPSLNKDMYAAILINVLDLYARQGYISKKVPTQKVISFLTTCLK